MPKVFSYETREEFLDLLCSGMSMQAAEGAAGVSSGVGLRWWRECGLMELKVLKGARGGLVGDSPASCPASCLAGERPMRKRRALTSEDRAVIAAGLRRELSLSAIAEDIDRHVSVISREVKRNIGA